MTASKKCLHDQLIETTFASLHESCIPEAFEYAMIRFERELNDTAKKGKTSYQFVVKDFKNEFKKQLTNIQNSTLEYRQAIRDAEIKALNYQCTPEEVEPELYVSIDDLPVHNLIVDYVTNVWCLDIEDPTSKDSLKIYWSIPTKKFVENTNQNKKN